MRLVSSVLVLLVILFALPLSAAAHPLDLAVPAQDQAQTQVQTPPGTPIDDTVANVPDDPRGDTVLWWASVGLNGLTTYLKWNNSWKRVTDPLHAEPGGVYEGRYYVRGTVYDWGTLAISSTVQYFLCRKFPALKKTFAYVNFGNSGVSLAQFGYNATNH